MSTKKKNLITFYCYAMISRLLQDGFCLSQFTHNAEIIVPDFEPHENKKHKKQAKDKKTRNQIVL